MTDIEVRIAEIIYREGRPFLPRSSASKWARSIVDELGLVEEFRYMPPATRIASDWSAE